MEKFGIFKLLNSFFDFYAKNGGAMSNNNNVPKTEKPESRGLGDIVTSLFGNKSFSTTNQNTVSNANGDKTNLKPEFVKAPLQNSMLSVMQTHDQAVKRILKSNKKV